MQAIRPLGYQVVPRFGIHSTTSTEAPTQRFADDVSKLMSQTSSTVGNLQSLLKGNHDIGLREMQAGILLSDSLTTNPNAYNSDEARLDIVSWLSRRLIEIQNLKSNPGGEKIGNLDALTRSVVRTIFYLADRTIKLEGPSPETNPTVGVNRLFLNS